MFTDHASDQEGNEVYTNRAVLYAVARWGKITRQEDFEDTHKIEAFDRWLDAHGIAPVDNSAGERPLQPAREVAQVRGLSHAPGK